MAAFILSYKKNIVKEKRPCKTTAKDQIVRSS